MCVVVSLILVVASVAHNWSLRARITLHGVIGLAEEWCGYWSQHGESADCLVHYSNTDHLLVSLLLSLVVGLHILHVATAGVLTFGICR